MCSVTCCNSFIGNISSCESYCTSRTSCKGYTYQRYTFDDRIYTNCILYQSDDSSCPSEDSTNSWTFSAGTGMVTSFTANDMVGNEGVDRGSVCYAKTAGKIAFQLNNIFEFLTFFSFQLNFLMNKRFFFNFIKTLSSRL